MFDTLNMTIFKSSKHIVLIDPEDSEKISGWKIYPIKNRNVFYALLCKWNSRLKRQEKKLLHRVIMNAPKGTMVCHLNGNGLDCQKSNLAFGNASINGSSFRTKNAWASSKYRGVHRNNGRGKRWTVMFWDAGKCIYLGRYNSEKFAALVYDREAKRRFGSFAHLNLK